MTDLWTLEGAIAELERLRAEPVSTPVPSLPEVIDAFEALCRRMRIRSLKRDGRKWTLVSDAVSYGEEYEAETLACVLRKIAERTHAWRIGVNTDAERRVDQATAEARIASDEANASRELMEQLGATP